MDRLSPGKWTSPGIGSRGGGSEHGFRAPRADSRDAAPDDTLPASVGIPRQTHERPVIPNEIAISEVPLIRIPVRDLGRAIGFYRDTLEIPILEVSDEQDFAYLNIRGATLLLDRVSPHDPPELRRVGGLPGPCLATDDLEAAYIKLRARGVRFVGMPRVENWGVRAVPFYDLDDNLLLLVDRKTS